MKIINATGNLFEIFYLDYGDSAKVQLEHLRPFEKNSKFLELPFLALQFVTHGIRPSGGISVYFCYYPYFIIVFFILCAPYRTAVILCYLLITFNALYKIWSCCTDSQIFPLEFPRTQLNVSDGQCPPIIVLRP